MAVAMEPEIHITGVLVHARPDDAHAVATALAALPGVEVRAAHGGKLVVVHEGADGRAVLEFLARLRDLPGVIDAALVYQHAEPASAMEEEIRDDDDPTRIHQA
jgi:nitrate reductase NapD